MARITQGISKFPFNFEILFSNPVDSRFVVQYLSDLTNSNTWKSTVDNNVYLYNGLLTVVIEDETPENNGLYYLKDANNYNNISAWKKIIDLDYFNNNSFSQFLLQKIIADDYIPQGSFVTPNPNSIYNVQEKAFYCSIANSIFDNIIGISLSDIQQNEYGYVLVKGAYPINPIDYFNNNYLENYLNQNVFLIKSDTDILKFSLLQGNKKYIFPIGRVLNESSFYIDFSNYGERIDSFFKKTTLFFVRYNASVLKPDASTFNYQYFGNNFKKFAKSKLINPEDTSFLPFAFNIRYSLYDAKISKFKHYELTKLKFSDYKNLKTYVTYLLNGVFFEDSSSLFEIECYIYESKEENIKSDYTMFANNTFLSTLKGRKRYIKKLKNMYVSYAVYGNDATINLAKSLISNVFNKAFNFIPNLDNNDIFNEALKCFAFPKSNFYTLYSPKYISVNSKLKFCGFLNDGAYFDKINHVFNSSLFLDPLYLRKIFVVSKEYYNIDYISEIKEITNITENYKWNFDDVKSSLVIFLLSDETDRYQTFLIKAGGVDNFFVKCRADIVLNDFDYNIPKIFVRFIQNNKITQFKEIEEIEQFGNIHDFGNFNRTILSFKKRSFVTNILSTHQKKKLGVRKGQVEFLLKTKNDLFLKIGSFNFKNQFFGIDFFMD